MEAGFEDGAQMLPLAFAIVLITVFLHGLSAKPLAKALGLSHPEKDCLIIVGASKWSFQLAETLEQREVEVLIADRNWYALKQARLGDIKTYYGEILSEETEYNIELTKYNMLLSVTNNPAYNSLVCNNFAHEFSRESTYQFVPHDESDHESRQINEGIRGEDFGNDELDFWEMSNLFNNGWRFKTTRVGNASNLEKILKNEKSKNLKIIGFIKSGNKLKRSLYLSRPYTPENLNEEDVLIILEEKKNKEL
jgi:hypothetical protein